MLQPVQLKDVAGRYAQQVSEVRDFLGKAGLRVGTAATLHEVAERLLSDRAFHRDLSSYLWVVIDGGERQISSADLLGVLAIAAAGADMAAEANEDDAHGLLRFVMDTRRSLEVGVSPIAIEDRFAARPTAAASAGSNSFDSADVGSSTRDAEPAVLHHARVSQSELNRPATPAQSARSSSGGRRRNPGWIVAGCVLAVLFLGLLLGRGLLRKPTVGAVRAPVSVDPHRVAGASADSPLNGGGKELSVPATDGSPGESRQLPEAEAPSQSPHAGPKLVPARRGAEIAPPRLSHPSQSLSPAPRDGRTAPNATAMVAIASPEIPSPAFPPATALPRLPDRSSSLAVQPVLIPRGTRPPGPAAKPLPAAVLSARLGSQAVPAYASAQEGDSKHPRLLRRRTATESAASVDGDAGLVAEVDSASSPVLPKPSGNLHGEAAHAGVVRPASLGMMAGNIMYSPSPVYPAAASAAHVQGEVKIQAEVGRDGNVIGARVVSGPPLLRDAALDAVQRWRYRPYLLGGKPVSMSTTAVVDFELP